MTDKTKYKDLTDSEVSARLAVLMNMPDYTVVVALYRGGDAVQHVAKVTAKDADSAYLLALKDAKQEFELQDESDSDVSPNCVDIFAGHHESLHRELNRQYRY
jgi:hypothetical protein